MVPNGEWLGLPVVGVPDTAELASFTVLTPLAYRVGVPINTSETDQNLETSYGLTRPAEMKAL